MLIRTFKLATAIAKGFLSAHRLGTLDKSAPIDRNALAPSVQKFCADVCDAIGIRVNIIGDMPQMHGLWASNHVSWVDIPVIGKSAPVFFLSKAEIGDWAVVGRLVRAGGTLFIRRGTGDVGQVARQLSDFLKTGHSVVFFPEATTTNGHAIKRIHGKLLQSAIDTQLPIVPVVLCYTKNGKLSERMPYFGKMDMKTSLKNVLTASDEVAHIMALDPITPKDGDTVSSLTDTLYARMSDGLNTLHARVLK